MLLEVNNKLSTITTKPSSVAGSGKESILVSVAKVFLPLCDAPSLATLAATSKQFKRAIRDLWASRILDDFGFSPPLDKACSREYRIHYRLRVSPKVSLLREIETDRSLLLVGVIGQSYIFKTPSHGFDIYSLPTNRWTRIRNFPIEAAPEIMASNNTERVAPERPIVSQGLLSVHVGGNEVVTTAGTTLTVWRVKGASFRPLFASTKGSSSYACDGRIIAYVSFDNKLFVWNVNNRELLLSTALPIERFQWQVLLWDDHLLLLGENIHGFRIPRDKKLFMIPLDDDRSERGNLSFIDKETYIFENGVNAMVKRFATPDSYRRFELNPQYPFSSASERYLAIPDANGCVSVFDHTLWEGIFSIRIQEGKKIAELRQHHHTMLCKIRGLQGEETLFCYDARIKKCWAKISHSSSLSMNFTDQNLLVVISEKKGVFCFRLLDLYRNKYLDDSFIKAEEKKQYQITMTEETPGAMAMNKQDRNSSSWELYQWVSPKA